MRKSSRITGRVDYKILHTTGDKIFKITETSQEVNQSSIESADNTAKVFDLFDPECTETSQEESVLSILFNTSTQLSKSFFNKMDKYLDRLAVKQAIAADIDDYLDENQIVIESNQ